VGLSPAKKRRKLLISELETSAGSIQSFRMETSLMSIYDGDRGQKPLPQIVPWHFFLCERRPRRDSSVELTNHIWATVRQGSTTLPHPRQADSG
jgi:hypothetical protein